MTLSRFTWTDRCRPIVQIGVGDTRIPTGHAVWDVSRWDAVDATWNGTQPVWHDITCDSQSFNCSYGRQRVTERFIVGTATVTVDNSTGWADPSHTPDLADTVTVRPGRSIRMGVEHETFGVRWLFRGFVDAVTPTYDPVQSDTVQLDCVDALGEVNRAKVEALTDPAYAGDTVTARINRILDVAQWAPGERDLWPSTDTLLASDMGGQIADLLGQAADSGGGSVFGDLEARIGFRPRDWQTFMPGTPVDGTIGNVDMGDDGTPNRVTFGEYNYVFFGDQLVYGDPVASVGDVCPTRWERPFARADITTRALMGNEAEPPVIVVLDDPAGQGLYGIEPFERTDLLTESPAGLDVLARRVLRTRSASTAPRVRSVSLDARTATNALDLMATVDVYDPSRYRCRLEYDRGLVFDDQYFATGVSHNVTPNGWTLDLNLDVAAPFEATGGRWDSAIWDQALWTDAVVVLTDALEALNRIEVHA